MSPAETFRAAGRRVIAEEAAALTDLSDALGEGFAQAAQMILDAPGRVIVTGMGKSGHIARKIAATFASTGTPAHFVHPAEASHGDLGMLARGDVVLVLSNSGETPELADLVAYTRRFGIPMIALTARDGSTLARQADAVIALPDRGEACGTGVVPSTSTTMALAAGDALAIALMEHRAFTPENFRDFHPGGRLGARLSRVRDLMHTGAALPLVLPEAPMADVLLTISQKGFGVVGVSPDEMHLKGVITDGDLRRHMDGLMDRTAGEVMTENPAIIGPGSLAEEAVAVMNARKITCLFAIDDRARIAGLIHIHDCLRAGIV